MTLSNSAAVNSSVTNPENSLDAMSLIHALHAQGAWRAIDVQFAQFIFEQAQRMHDDNASTLGVLACALSVELGQGNTCLSLEQPLNSLDIHKHLAQLGLNVDSQNTQQLFQQFDELKHQNWLEIARQSSLVYEAEVYGADKANCERAQFETPTLPLVLENGRLFLTRYWAYEANVAEQLKRRATQAGSPSDVLAASTDEIQAHAIQKDMLNQLFSSDPNDDINWQKVAAAIAISRQFTVISGGPGTGKTTTVVKLLATLLAPTSGNSDANVNGNVNANGNETAHEKRQAPLKMPKIQLVAPTGKAAARLTESIGSAIDKLTIEPELKKLIPRQATTIHRLLGARHNTKAYRHHKNNPLHLDVLVVDEASMVDLPMMSQLLDALPESAKLILLGDKDQLSSVEAGAVLGDIFQAYQIGYSEDYATTLEALTGYSLPQIKENSNPVSDSICVLQKSYRFDENSGIGCLARAINQGDVNALNATWQKGFSDLSFISDISFKSEPFKELSLGTPDNSGLIELMSQGYQAYLKESYLKQADLIDEKSEKSTHIPMPDHAKKVLNAFAQLRLLCAIREGEFGVNGMNTRIEQALIKQGNIINPSEDTWYIGKPVMVTRNDGVLGLHNGDIGVCLQDNDSENKVLRVYFELPDGSIKGFLPSRIHHYELAFAMTIHKSQGSEFAHTVMLLPPNYTPILTRELIYTGVTRAKSQFTLFSSKQVLEKGIQTPTVRVSGLGERLRAGSEELIANNE